MPDPTNLEQLQEQKRQESLARYKRTAVERALMVLDPAYTFHTFTFHPDADYATLVSHLRRVLDEELANLTTPPPPPPPDVTQEERGHD